LVLAALTVLFAGSAPSRLAAQAEPSPNAKSVTLLGQPAQDFARRRADLMERLRKLHPAPDDGAAPRVVAVLKGWEINREDYEEGKIRQSNPFAYLTGVESPSAALLLIPHEQSARLYLPARRGRFGLGAGPPGPGPGAEAASHYGIDQVEPTSRLLPDLFAAMGDMSSTIVYVVDQNSPNRPTGKLARWLREGIPALALRPLEPVLAEMRKIKSSVERETLKRAIAITGEAFDQVMATIAPGQYEYELEGRIIGAFLSGGAQRPGFASIVGSGPNGTIPHYFDNNRKLGPDELVVIDIGAEFNYYTADITRTLPTGGKFTPRQRELYQLVLDAQRACEEHMKPGETTLGEMTRFTADYLRKSPLRAKDLAGDEQTMDRFFIHGLGHYLGMEVHDVGDIGKPIQPGEVFTIEPGLYIESESIGIRIEDDYLVTETGLEKLSSAIPSEPDAVEKAIAAAQAKRAAAQPKP
jgi:Xaa-Pro aminopeptidase